MTISYDVAFELMEAQFDVDFMESEIDIACTAHGISAWSRGFYCPSKKLPALALVAPHLVRAYNEARARYRDALSAVLSEMPSTFREQEAENISRQAVL